jgi:hypothetical protein
MSFPENWGHDAAQRLIAIARGTVRHATEQEGEWLTPLPQLRTVVRYSAGYDAVTASHMAPADTFGRHVLLSAPHFEVRVRPGKRWWPAGATIYRTGADQAVRVLKEVWGSDIFSELSPAEASTVAAVILGPVEAFGIPWSPATIPG